MQPGEEIESLIADLEDLVNNAKSPTFGGEGKKVIDTEEFFQITDDIRDMFPEQFAQARRIIKEEDEILSRAEAQSDAIISDAQQQAVILASDQEVVRLAQKQADEIRDAAQQYERDTRYNAEEYADEVLNHLESNMKSIVNQVSACRQTLSANAATNEEQAQAEEWR